MLDVMRILAIILALLIPQMAAARLGETEEQCDERYGKSTGEIQTYNQDGKWYRKGIYDIAVVFMDGKVAHIRYEADADALSGESVGDQMLRLIALNLCGTANIDTAFKKMKQLKVPSDKAIGGVLFHIGKNMDKIGLANYVGDKLHIIAETGAYNKHWNKIKKQRKLKALDGF